MSDLISREDAVNAIYHHFRRMSKPEVEMVLRELPSAEPQTEIDMAYMRGRIDGINYCTERLRKTRMEAEHD